jgi:hypothetical protein
MNSIRNNKDILIMVIKFIVLYEGIIRGWSLKKNTNNELILTKKVSQFTQYELNDILKIIQKI